ncbi:GGDEF domain-containing protein [Burkholderia sp. AU16741]|uniref:GGDEF domain-containing protein n=1 Tax=Burkholderia sp. AU16741 TaxID=2015347 RepID=UPI00211AFA9E|nr:GGDEF domain-containing protein [Burkholderia sp. AU16741]
MNGKHCAAASRTAGTAYCRRDTAGRASAPFRCGRPGTRCRKRRVCYRKYAPRDALSSWKTDLDQIGDSATPSAGTLLRSIAAMLPDDGTDMHALIEHADQAMYEAKRTRTQRAARA